VSGPFLPMFEGELHPGDLVHYRWWCAAVSSWITDGVPHVVIDAPDAGMVTILMEKGPIKLPMSLLQRACDVHINT